MKNKYACRLLFSLLSGVLSLVFVACGDDEEDYYSPEGNNENITDVVLFRIIGENEVYVTNYDEATGKTVKYAGYIDIPEATTIEGKTYRVTGIEKRAFKDCEDVKSVYLPRSIESIEQEAFYGCSSLTSISLPRNVKYIEMEDGKGVFGKCTSLKQIDVDYSNQNFASYNGILYDKEKVILIAYPGGEEVGSKSLATSTRMIAKNAFSGARFQWISLPYSLLNVGDYAFRDCEMLSGINFPENVAFIGEGCMSGCSRLKSVTFAVNVQEIGSLIFDGCNSLESVTCIGPLPPVVVPTDLGDRTLAANWNNPYPVILYVTPQYIDNYLNTNTTFTSFFREIKPRNG